ncbi:hypothetical protein GCM10010289_79360 [Streptomyces violascens]|nr:hypothetical protein GCM10010289_79360 [Streptomyces violascens]
MGDDDFDLIHGRPVLEHAAAYNLKTVMTFHHRVEEAKAFAAKLP